VNGTDPQREKRRRLVRLATTWTLIYAAAGVVVAAGSAALIAFMLTFAGMPFRQTWLVTVAALIVVPLVGIAVRELRDRLAGGGDGQGTNG